MYALSTLLTEIYGTSEKSDWERLTPSHNGFVTTLTNSVKSLQDSVPKPKKSVFTNHAKNANEALAQKVMSHFGIFIESRFFCNQIATNDGAGIEREDVAILADTELLWSNLATKPDMSISIRDRHEESTLYNLPRDPLQPTASKPCHLLGIFEMKDSDPFLNIPFDECRFKSIPSPRFNYITIYGVGDKDQFELGLYSPLYENRSFSDANVKRNGVIHRFSCRVDDEHFVAKMLQYCDTLVAFMGSIYQSQGSCTVVHNVDSFLSHFPEWEGSVADQSGEDSTPQVRPKMNSMLERMGSALDSAKSPPTPVPPETPLQTQPPNPDGDPEQTQRRQQAQDLIEGYLEYTRAVLVHIAGPHLFKRTAGQSRLALPHIQRYQQRSSEQRRETENIEAVLVVGHYLDVQSAQTDDGKVQKESHRASHPQQYDLSTTPQTSHTTSQTTPKSSTTSYASPRTSHTSPSQTKSPRHTTTTSKDGAIATIITLQGGVFPSLTLANFNFNLLNPQHTDLFLAFFRQQAQYLRCLHDQGFRFCDIRPANTVVEVVACDGQDIKDMKLQRLGTSKEVDTTTILEKVLNKEWGLKLHLVDTEYITYCPPKTEAPLQTPPTAQPSPTTSATATSATSTSHVIATIPADTKTPQSGVESTPQAVAGLTQPADLHVAPRISFLRNFEEFKPLVLCIYKDVKSRKDVESLRVVVEMKSAIEKYQIASKAIAPSLVSISKKSSASNSKKGLVSASNSKKSSVSASNSKKRVLIPVSKKNPAALPALPALSALPDVLLASKNRDWLAWMDWSCMINSYRLEVVGEHGSSRPSIVDVDTSEKFYDLMVAVTKQPSHIEKLFAELVENSVEEFKTMSQLSADHD